MQWRKRHAPHKNGAGENSAAAVQLRLAQSPQTAELQREKSLGRYDLALDDTLAAESGTDQLGAAYHYTSSQWAESITRTGLRPGTYATPASGLGGLQAQLELSLNPTRAAPDFRISSDLQAMREAGYEIPAVARVWNVVKDPVAGRIYTMPGGGYEMRFPYAIPPKYLEVKGIP